MVSVSLEKSGELEDIMATATKLSKQRGNWVTMEDVATRAEVSKITVSRVLRDPEKVREVTRERVFAAVRELGYLPDDAAGALTTRSSKIVAALISTLEGSTFASTVDGLSRQLREAGYQLLLATTDYSPEREADILSTLLRRRPDGLVMTSSQHTSEARALLKRAQIPVVELWELPSRPIDCAVGFSNFSAGQAMTEFLLNRGYRRPVFIGAREGSDGRARSRSAGYAAAISERCSFTPRTVVAPADVISSTERGASGLVAALESWPDTDCVFCASDSVALGAISEARRRSLCVPDDIAVAGYGDFDFAGGSGLELTTVRIAGIEIGERAAELILQRLQGNRPKRKSIDVGFEVVARATA
jgi:LacI family gluconate utilization system Gnt-I transcriptional repressor